MATVGLGLKWTNQQWMKGTNYSHVVMGLQKLGFNSLCALDLSLNRWVAECCRGTHLSLPLVFRGCLQRASCTMAEDCYGCISSIIAIELLKNRNEFEGQCQHSNAG